MKINRRRFIGLTSAGIGSLCLPFKCKAKKSSIAPNIKGKCFILTDTDDGFEIINFNNDQYEINISEQEFRKASLVMVRVSPEKLVILKNRHGKNGIVRGLKEVSDFCIEIEKDYFSDTSIHRRKYKRINHKTIVTYLYSK